jgi:GTP-binding protein
VADGVDAPDASGYRINAVFTTSAPSLLAAPADDLPEVAVAGRSNAGKSSVLNQITGNRQLARTSKTPGRTQLINFFTTDLGGRIVDLPGYGYARAGKLIKRAWQEHLEDYLAVRSNLVAVILVMDVRHPFQPFDAQMLAWARAARMRMHVLLNKSDKLRHGARQNALRAAERALPEPLLSVQLFSAAIGLGRAELIDRLRDWLTVPTIDPD